MFGVGDALDVLAVAAVGGAFVLVAGSAVAGELGLPLLLDDDPLFTIIGVLPIGGFWFG